MQRDFLDGAEKITRIMSVTLYACRQCGKQYRKHGPASNCCKKLIFSFNKNRSEFDNKYKEIANGI